MTGSKYVVSMDELKDHGALHTDAHIFFMKIQEEQPDIIIAMMAHLLLKAGLKEWGTKAHNAVKSNMKQLQFRNKFKPML